MGNFGSLLVVAVLCAACTSPDVAAADDACGSNGACPQSFVCHPGTNRCVRPGAALTPDASMPDAAAPAEAPSPDAPVTDAPPPVLSIAPATLDVASVALGDTSSPLALTVTNEGGSTSGALAVMLSDAEDFAVTGGTCPGATVAAGGSCTVLVAFHPVGAAGPRLATLTVGDGRSPIAATVTGTALTPGQITMTPTSNGFGRVPLGSRSAEARFTVQNRGQAATGRLSLALSDTADFVASSNDCPDASTPARAARSASGSRPRRSASFRAPR